VIKVKLETAIIVESTRRCSVLLYPILRSAQKVGTCDTTNRSCRGLKNVMQFTNALQAYIFECVFLTSVSDCIMRLEVRSERLM
jgi:hypothetical protein